jgi:hypothetical protein
MIPSQVDETLPELAPLVHAVQARRPDDGTWCEAWTVRDILVHQAGNAEEPARVLQAFLAGAPVETRGFDREGPLPADVRLRAGATPCRPVTLAQLRRVGSPAQRTDPPGRLLKARFLRVAGDVTHHVEADPAVHPMSAVSEGRLPRLLSSSPWR